VRFFVSFAHHTSEVNTANDDVIVGIGTTEAANRSGGRHVGVSTNLAVEIPIDDANKIYCSAVNAGDSVQYQIIGDAEL
jgi:hypothetical protein